MTPWFEDPRPNHRKSSETLLVAADSVAGDGASLASANHMRWAAIAFVAAASANFIATPRCIAVRADVHMSDADAILIEAPLASIHHKALTPRWVKFINSALEESAVASVVAFVLIDIGSAATLLAAIIALNVHVPSNFALAFALSKSVRIPRLALDASGAALLARRWPSLAAVRVTLMIDAATRASARLSRSATRLLPSARRSSDTSQVHARRNDKLDRVSNEVRRLTDQFGLAYMAAKNVIGPMSILLTYAALQTCGGSLAPLLERVGGASTRNLGRAAARVALASTASTLLFPAVVMGAAWLGPLLERARVRALGTGSTKATPVMRKQVGPSMSSMPSRHDQQRASALAPSRRALLRAAAAAAPFALGRRGGAVELKDQGSATGGSLLDTAYAFVGDWLTEHPAPMWIVNNPLKRWVTTKAAGDYDRAVAQATLREILAKDDVVLFSATYCPFSLAAKRTLADQGIAFQTIEWNTRGDGPALVAELGALTGRTSIPHIWVGGEYIGGLNDGLGTATAPGLRPLIVAGGLRPALDKAAKRPRK